MRHHIVAMGLVLLAGSCLPAAEAPMKDNAREYLALRATLQATTLDAMQAGGPRSPWRGKTVEVYGRIVGRTAGSAARATPATIMLQFPGVRELLLLDVPDEQGPAAIDNVVHVLAQLPANAKPTDRFTVKAIILEADLPAAEQRYAADTANNPTPVAGAISQQVGTGTGVKEGKDAPDAVEAPAPPAPPAPPQQTATRPGSQMPTPQLKGISDNTVGVWKQWVRRINSKLTDSQLELIVRSVIYYSALYGVDHRLAFSMIKCESDFDPSCLSHAGASGLCQLMPGTAAGLGVDRWDIEQNIMGGIKYLSDQLHAYSNRSNYEQFALGLASYNAGPGAVKRAGGVPNIPETVRYVKKVGDLFVQLYRTMP